ncbi:MAG: radical SAM protein [Aigarchaeota archaeon]|nr:radical SAM protein [Aigarchaeota archaeon]MCX8192387.1 radical SAM protein [Nitrososphaeria archaeon]MDW7986495.1 radical SAM protein [Nitrososphaerota archaeon]
MVSRLIPPIPTSCGIFLTYRCNSKCRHCMYACSPRWSSDWISTNDLKRIISQLADKIQSPPYGFSKIGVNYGLHFTGGEPFLNYQLLLEAVKIARDYEIPSIFVETNSFWCVDEAEEKLMELKKAGLEGILVSVNPFIVEYIPFERIEKNISLSLKIFGSNTIIYQYEFYRQFKEIDLKGLLKFEDYLSRFGLDGLRWVELIPMGRACYELRDLFYKYPAEYFFKVNCRSSLLREWHTHIDNYGNYITGYCGGISLGDARKLDQLIDEGIDLDERLILNFLVNKNLGELYKYAVKEFNYRERQDGYISRCDLCLDIRRCIALQSREFYELSPREYYQHLTTNEELNTLNI